MKKTKQFIIYIVLPVLVAYAGVSVLYTLAQGEEITYQAVLPSKDAVDLYIDRKRAGNEANLVQTERIIRETLVKENEHMELKDEFYATRTLYASSTEDMIVRMDLLASLGINQDYDAIASKMHIRTINE